MRIMEDVNDEAVNDRDDEPDIEALTTDDLRREVERMSLLLKAATNAEEKRADNDVTLEAVSDDDDDDVPADDALDLAAMPENWSPVEETTLKYTNGDVYKGEAVDNRIRHGKGMHQCSNGDYYDGAWKDDKRHGKGKLTYVSGLSYDGEWIDDKANGHGVCVYVDGGKYTGEWKADLKHGWGMFRYATGDVYEGEWVDNVAEGNGRYTYSGGNTFFQGKFLNGSRVKGKLVSGDEGVEYDGEWKDDARHGKGTFHLPGVYKYTGDWKEDERHGVGKCVYADGATYDGEWKSDEKHGKGKHKSNEGVYDGEWKQNMKHGTGTMVFSASGGKYVGEWKEGKEDGNGKRLYPDGTVYEGNWQDGKRHGKGNCAFACKDVYKGEWVRDMRHGYGVCTYADGSKYRGEWEEDCWLQSTADPAFTKVFGPGLSRGIAGEATVFGIEARDELKNKRMNGGDEFYVRFENDETKAVAFGEITDNDDGTYAVSFRTTAAGSYTCSILIGDEEHVADSPYPVRILPARPFPKRCQISGEGHRVATTLETAFFYVEAFDRHGNAVQGNIGDHLPLNVTITSHDDEITEVDICDTGEGRYKMSFTPSKKGFYRVVVESSGVHIGQSPYSLQVRSNESPETAHVDDVDIDVVAIAPPPDKVRQWEDIAMTEYIRLDGDEGGWESEPEEEETPEQKAIRENPDVPVISNLEDLYKLPRLQKAMREEKRKKQAAKLKAMRKRFEAEEAAARQNTQQVTAAETKSVEPSSSNTIADLD